MLTRNVQNNGTFPAEKQYCVRMTDEKPQSFFQRDIAVLMSFAALILVVHWILGNGYGFHRDELQLLDDARHLQWGFVAYPPLTAFCGRVAIALFGISPQVFRLPAALANAVSLVLVGLTARELGGRRAAQLLAMAAAFPWALGFSSLLQYNTFDLLAWCIVTLFTARLLRTEDGRNWVGVGVGVGIGVLSKYSIAFLAVSLLAGVAVLPQQRRWLRSRWFWYGALMALVIAAPNLIWLPSHQFITLRMESFIHMRDVRLGRAAGFYTDQLKFTHVRSSTGVRWFGVAPAKFAFPPAELLLHRPIRLAGGRQRQGLLPDPGIHGVVRGGCSLAGACAGRPPAMGSGLHLRRGRVRNVAGCGRRWLVVSAYVARRFRSLELANEEQCRHGERGRLAGVCRAGRGRARSPAA